MIQSIVFRSNVQIYQQNKFSFYYFPQESGKIHQYVKQIDTFNFSFNLNKFDYISIYDQTNKQIDHYIEINDVQINRSSDGLTNAIVCAFLIYKAFDMEDALKVMDLLQIEQPRIQYLCSLKQYEEQIYSEPKLNRSSIILKPEIDLEQTIQNSMIQSEILNFPIFSQRLIETQKHSQILPSEYQAQSEIFDQQQLSFISFGKQEYQNISEEPQINKIQTSLILSRKL